MPCGICNPEKNSSILELDTSHHFFVLPFGLLQKGETYSISPIQIIAVCENRSKIALALASYIMVIVMVFCSSIEWNILCWGEWEIKAAK
jgi:hypothetical protein